MDDSIQIFSSISAVPVYLRRSLSLPRAPFQLSQEHAYHRKAPFAPRTVSPNQTHSLQSPFRIAKYNDAWLLRRFLGYTCSSAKLQCRLRLAPPHRSRTGMLCCWTDTISPVVQALAKLACREPFWQSFNQHRLSTTCPNNTFGITTILRASFTYENGHKQL
jgi:hypothetical protein